MSASQHDLGADRRPKRRRRLSVKDVGRTAASSRFCAAFRVPQVSVNGHDDRIAPPALGTGWARKARAAGDNSRILAGICWPGCSPDGAVPAGVQGSHGVRCSSWAKVHVTRADALAYARWAGGTLPTEAQWEYAAKVGLRGARTHAANTWQGEFPLRDSAADGHAGTAPAGSYPPDALGLSDMLGNVWELTRSVDTSGQRAVIKGGSFLCNARYCNSARPDARQWQDVASSAAHVGFRVATRPCP